MPISEAQVRTAKSAAKAFKLYDSEGLFLLVTPSGGKLWRLRFKFDEDLFRREDARYRDPVR